MATNKVTWTEEKNEQLLALAKEGKTRKEIAYTMGTSEGAVSVQLCNLRKKGKDAPHIAKEESNADGRCPEGDTIKEGTGELNDLEKTLSELVTELQGEKDNLVGELTAMTDRCKNQSRTINELMEKLEAAEEALRASQMEAEDARLSNAATEKQMDEERAENEEYRSKHISNLSIINQLNKKLDHLTQEHQRTLDITMGLIEKFVLPGGEVPG